MKKHNIDERYTYQIYISSKSINMSYIHLRSNIHKQISVDKDIGGACQGGGGGSVDKESHDTCKGEGGGGARPMDGATADTSRLGGGGRIRRVDVSMKGASSDACGGKLGDPIHSLKA